MSSRLNTEELVQATRHNYEGTKQQERIHELEVTLQLRNREVHHLTTQLTDSKQHQANINALLNSQLTHAKQQLAELRLTGLQQKKRED